MVHKEFGFADEEDSIEKFEREFRKRQTTPKEEPLPQDPIQAISFQLSKTNGNLRRVISLLETLVEANKKDLIVRKFDTGNTTLPNAIATVPDMDNVNPLTGYTRVVVNDILHRNAPEFHFLNYGPGSIFLRTSPDGKTFSQTEIQLFRGDHKIFYDIYEIRLRTDTADTRYTASENDIEPGFLIQAVAQSDRNPIIRFFRFADIVGPHADTNRFTYTVPAMKKAIIANVHSFIRIATAQGAGNEGLKINNVFAFDGTTRAFLTFAFLGQNSDTIGQNDGRNISDAGFLTEGLQIRGNTNITGTGGTFGVDLSALIIEVDV